MAEGLPRCLGNTPPAPRKLLGAAGAACVFGAGVCLLPSLASVLAAEPPTLDVNEDVRQELLARQTLFQDKLVGPLNLGVRVRQRVAVLWGPAPSAELARRAVALLQERPEWVEVRDELIVQPAEERPSRDRYLPPLDSLPPAPNVSRAAPTKAGVLTKHSALALGGSPSPVGYPQGMSADRGKRGPPAPADFKREPVLPAIRIPVQAGGASAGTDAGEALIEAVTRLQRADPRFSRLHAEVRGKTVHLRGEVQGWTVVHELARTMARLPGVERVVLGDIRALGPR
jgi:hypothetical protein